MKISKVINDAKTILATKGWTQDTLYNEKEGSYCLTGAMMKVCGVPMRRRVRIVDRKRIVEYIRDYDKSFEDEFAAGCALYYNALDITETALIKLLDDGRVAYKGGHGDLSLELFNDYYGRKKSEVYELLNAAVQLAREKESESESES